MTADRKQRGLTLTSIMVAVALSGVLAVAGVRLVVNQMNALRVMELIDKGDTIFKFYSNLLHDDQVWWCTLYHDIEGSATTHINKNMRECVFSVDSSKCKSAEQNLELRGPDCEFKEPVVGGKTKRRFKYEDHEVGGRDFYYQGAGKAKNFTSSPTTFIPSGGKPLKDSVIKSASGGWWNVKLTWKDATSGGGTTGHAVDLILTQTFDANKWMTVPTGGKRYLPQLNYPRQLRMRRSANYIDYGSRDCGDYAVTAIALHTANRTVSCHDTPLVPTSGALGECPFLNPKGQVVMSNDACSGSRVSVTPTDCVKHYSVISKIGEGAGAAVPNVECALGGRGKMVDYSSNCPPSITDKCEAPNSQVFSVVADKHIALQRISGAGDFNTDQECGTLMGFPHKDPITLTVPGSNPSVSLPGAPGQGPVGAKGRSKCGPAGPPGTPTAGCVGTEGTHWYWQADPRACPP